MIIQICGPGCAKCNEVEKIVKDLVAETGCNAEVEKITDFQEIAKLGILSTPGVVIDGHIKSVGKVPSGEEVKSWLI
ncbi:thioredoxin family protein [Thermodesulfobacteriota bacterium]